MDFCTAHFGKNLSSLTIQDVKSYFSLDRIENDQIEFKSIRSGGYFNEMFIVIQRTVTAFLNSSGGLIIWGAPVGQKIPNKKEKIFNGELTYFDQIIEKEFVVSKISDSIIPLPNNIRVNILEDENKSVVIIEIDSSEYSPHQSANSYYMRIDGQTKPAPHHYIEALFKRIKYPDVEAYLKIVKIGLSTGSKYKVDFNIFFFNWSPLQNEEKLSFRILTDGVFGNSGYSNNIERYAPNGHEYFKEIAKDIFYFGEPILESNMILFDRYKLEQNGNKCKIYISFGGKFSPRKTCEYELDLKTNDVNNPNDIIFRRSENKLIADTQEEKGMTKEMVIKTFMEL